MNSKPAKAQGSPRKTPKKITETYLHNAGLYYLQRFAASSAHFHEIMMRKVHKSCRYHADQDPAKCRKMVDDLVARFRESGLLNDESYAQAVITTLRRQGKSARAIQAKLRARGLGGDAITEQMNVLDAPDAEFQAAFTFIRKKKIGPFRTAGKPALPEKELAALGRAGFSYETSRRVLAMESSDV